MDHDIHKHMEVYYVIIYDGISVKKVSSQALSPALTYCTPVTLWILTYSMCDAQSHPLFMCFQRKTYFLSIWQLAPWP